MLKSVKISDITGNLFVHEPSITRTTTGASFKDIQFIINLLILFCVS